MVASDTVVGLVGAGILLVALVGVFVYESQQGQGEGADLKTASYQVATAGSSYSYQQPSGTTNPVTGQCVVMGQCTPARATIDFKFQGLPLAGSLKYVVFIDSETGTAVNAGEATPSGKDHITGSKTVNGRFGSTPKVHISLETNKDAATPGWKICSLTVSGSGLGTCEAKIITTSGNHTVTFTASGASLNVEAKLDNLQNKTGYTYRGWMVKESDAGLNYTFVGNFTASGVQVNTAGEMDGTISGTVPGARADYARFIVTIEPQSAGIGIRPAGPPVVTADYNVPASPTLEK